MVLSSTRILRSLTAYRVGPGRFVVRKRTANGVRPAPAVLRRDRQYKSGMNSPYTRQIRVWCTQNSTDFELIHSGDGVHVQVHMAPKLDLAPSLVMYLWALFGKPGIFWRLRGANIALNEVCIMSLYCIGNGETRNVYG